MYMDIATKKAIMDGFVDNIKAQFSITYELCKKYPENKGHLVTAFDGYLDAMDDASEIIDYRIHDECHLYRKAIRRAVKYDLVWVANADLYR